MTYDNPRFRGDDPDDGFRDSPAFRDSVAYREAIAARNATGRRDVDYEEPTPRTPVYTPGTFPIGGYQSTDYGTDNTLGLEPEPAPVPVPVPPPPRPPRDRLAVHFGWEIVLFLGVAAVGVLLWRAEPAALRGAALRDLYVETAAFGTVAVAMALSLRAAVPNLALGPIAFAAAMFFAENSDRGILVTAGVTGLLAAAVGVAMAIVVTAFQVPAWAASLAGGLGLIAWMQDHRGGLIRVVDGAYQPADHAAFWFAGFVVLSVVGGLLGLVPAVRRAAGRYRPAGDPSVRGRGAASAALALIGSSVLAAAAGVLLALHTGGVAPTENGIGLTAFALGAALLGGTSVFGRHGGLFGTALAVILLALLPRYVAAIDREFGAFALAAAAIGVGLLVTRLVEVLGRPKTVPEAVQFEAVQYEPDPAPLDDIWTNEPAPVWAPNPAERSPEDRRWDERWASH